MQNINKYPLTIRIIHAISAIFIIFAIGVGLYMTSLPGDNPNKWELYTLHKSFGIILLILAFIRPLIRWKAIIPKLPDQISKTNAKLSAFVIFTLYLCMIIMPLSGYIASAVGGYGVKLFTYDIPNYFNIVNSEISQIAMSIHVICAYFLIAMLALHIIAPFKHLIIDKVNIFRRII